MDAQGWSYLLLCHALQITLLAILVGCLTSSIAKNRTHLAHALWVLVLLKCIMPPTLSSPTSVFSWMTTAIQHSSWWKSAQADAALPSDVDLVTAQIFGVFKSEDSREFISDGSDVSASALSSGHSAGATPSREYNGHRAVEWLLIAIAVGSVACFLRTWIRFRRFMTQAFKLGVRNDPQIDALVSQLCKRLQVRRKVQARIVKSTVGPVVVGLRSPQLLLPEVILEGRSAKELEPLIAHELIHIRRGDLWWALLQATASSLWWFHPFVSFACCMVTRESERSCDEETVRSLGCSPKEYAHSLLSVLECKYQLQVTPVLPGVRPVDLTLNRMERIMKLRQGSRPRSSQWSWATLVVGCAVVLPSAALSQTPKTPTEQETAPVPEVLQSSFQSRSWDVGDLLDKLKVENLSEGEAKKRLLSQLPKFEAQEVGKVTSELGVDGKLVVNLPVAKIVGNELQVFTLASRVDRIDATLKRLREKGFQQVQCELKILKLSPTDSAEITQAWTPLQEFYQSQAYPRFETVSFSKPKSVSFRKQELDETSFETLLTGPRVTTLSAPRIIAISGQRATISMGSEEKVDDKLERPWDLLTVDVQPVVVEEGVIQVSCRLMLQKRNKDTSPDETIEEKTAPIVVGELAFTELTQPGKMLLVGALQTEIDGQPQSLIVGLNCSVHEGRAVNEVKGANAGHEKLLPEAWWRHATACRLIGPVRLS